MIKVVNGELENVLSECPSPGTLIKREDGLLTKSMDCLPSQGAGPPFPPPVYGQDLVKPRCGLDF